MSLKSKSEAFNNWVNEMDEVLSKTQFHTIDGQPSAHFEHTIAITDNGPRILSKGSNA